jgi:hypothetical protein
VTPDRAYVLVLEREAVANELLDPYYLRIQMEEGAASVEGPVSTPVQQRQQTRCTP